MTDPAPVSRELALRVLLREAAAIERTAARLDAAFDRAVELVASTPGKVITSGIGKSGLVAQKIAATLASTGVHALSIHPVDALHGDIGAVRPGDVVIALSESGHTQELLTFVDIARARETHVIAITARETSPLARLSDCVLVVDAPPEGDIVGVLPTASTTAAIAMGDAIAMAAMLFRGVTLDDLERNHPAGTIGAGLTVRVDELRHPLPECAVVSGDAPMSEVVLRMTRTPLGAALVMDGHVLHGIVTEGDLRRGLQADAAAFMASLAAQHMTRNPRVVRADARALDALRLMEDAPPVYVLPVVDGQGRCTGLLRMHDLIQRGLAASRGES